MATSDTRRQTTPVTMEAKSPLGQRMPSYPDASNLSETSNRRRVHLVAPHVDSYNYFLESGLATAISDILPLEMKVDENVYVKMMFTSAQIGSPMRKEDNSSKLTPREARERNMSYGATFVANVSVVVNDTNTINFSAKFGDMPVMVMSERCHLRGLSSNHLVSLKEEPNEVGGYFITNGIERVIRLLQVPRRNYATAIERSSYKNRGAAYSDKGVQMRCVRPDQSSVTITLHYLTNGGATLRFVLRKQEFLLPVILVAKALAPISDKEFFDRVVQGDKDNTFMTTRLELLLKDAKSYNIYTPGQARQYFGSLFRGFLPITDKASDEDAGLLLLQRFLFVHVAEMDAKLECLIFMIRKLFAFAQEKCVADNADALTNHDILLPGHLITTYVKEKLEETLLAVKQAITRDFRINMTKCLAEIQNQKYYQKNFDRFGGGLGKKIESFLSSGNIVSSTGMDLMQVSGYTIVAERLNFYRYTSHFQSVHRGQFFTTMKTTTVRKLLPESWGFLCPVHTPDGGPCGLLNHMSKEAAIVSFPTHERLPTTPSGALIPPTGPDGDWKWSRDMDLKRLLMSVGIVPAGAGAGDGSIILNPNYIPVCIDGVTFGGVNLHHAADVVRQLRILKSTGGPKDAKTRLDPTTELAYIPFSTRPGTYPGLFIFTQPGRFVRPVIQLDTKKIEWIGSLEQSYMEIACIPEDVTELTTHIEISPTAMLSHVASLGPYCDYNQSPRNMYQCQMGKQTMGTPAIALKYRPDNKLFRIQNPQAALVQNKSHADYCMDEYPQGTNAVVAVISYTGFDMEDAMIINKSAYERGFGHGCVYKTKIIDLDEEEKRGMSYSSNGKPSLRFSNIKTPSLQEMEMQQSGTETPRNAQMIGEKYVQELDWDGLPCEGTIIEPGSPLICMVDSITGAHKLIPHKENERAYVETVRVLGSQAPGNNVSGRSDSKKGPGLRKISITLRIRRNPVIGDKFSSRHGQKGTLSVLWPQENMPFSESGMSPDVLINPHAFPSRMTIGMLIESMAGKTGALLGKFQDSTPFQFHEKDRIIDHVGEQLRNFGYNYYGSEPLYNGHTGKLMQADIFIGVVYYQRLRHMVSDKSQARSTGAVMAITRQPVKGRKKHGGIRLGEMERDALLSHGVSYCLQDRLMNCSDSHIAHVCNKCGELLPVYKRSVKAFSSGRREQFCSKCNSASDVMPIYLPFVCRYLINELAGMGIKMTMKLSE